MVKSKWVRRGGWSVYLLWHLIFVIVALSIFLPYLTLPIINDARIGAAPWSYAIYVSILIALPFVSLAIVWRYFQSDVISALKLFYAIELPLMLLLLLRVTLFRDAPVAAQFLFLNIATGIATYFFMLFNSKGEYSQQKITLQFIFSTVTALVGIYLGLLLGIYFLPSILSLLGGIWGGLSNPNFEMIGDFLNSSIRSPLISLLLILLFFTSIFFLITPAVLIYAYLHQFIIRCKRISLQRVVIITSGVLLFETIFFTLSYEQPQLQAFELTENLPVDESLQRKLLAESEIIRKGLLSAYLSPYRYLSTTEGSLSIKRSYEKIAGNNSAIADYAQSMFNGLAAPFLYQGTSFSADKERASERYQQFFDTPVDKNERDEILATIKATWENEQNEAGLINAASQHVLLTNQLIKVEEHNDFAKITITQTLLNQTYQPQEVLFHFKLPEDAVITGLWMSDDESNPEKFNHVVSPRGAAQSVYKSEVRRRIDPALLEKTGPVQYRLRAFPVPARQLEHKTGRNRYSKAFKDYKVSPALVQFQYVVSIDTKGHWPMPELLEKRNVYWNDQTVRSHKTETLTGWLPQYLAASNSVTLQTHSTLVKNEVIRAIPRDNRTPDTALTGPVAVIVDGSYSMNQALDSLHEQLQWLQEKAIEHDLFFCQLTCVETSIKAVREKVHFGNSQLSQQLSAWSESQTKHYSSIFVLTDQGSYELSPDEELKFNVSEQPLWLVHLGEQLPYAYDDAVIDALNDSHGGIARTLSDAVNKFLWAQQRGQSLNDGELIDVSKRYFWYRLNSTKATDDDALFTALAADKWTNYLAAGSDKSQLEKLDQIHSVAKQYDIVSFFSSMLVLVEDRQRQLLKKAEARNDRFEREPETGTETLSNPMDPFAVPGVPEPEEWALLILAGCLLLISYARRRGLMAVA